MGEASAEASARTTDFFFLHPLLSFPNERWSYGQYNCKRDESKREVVGETNFFDMRCWFGFLTDAEEFLDV